VFPKIIHQTWKDEKVPAFLAPCQESWKRLNPSWEYRLWTDADNDALVRDEFPSLLDLYRSLPRAIHRADFARVLYLWRFGGLYVDLDIEALRSADELLDDHSPRFMRNGSAAPRRSYATPRWRPRQTILSGRT
jgi:mannosyltransferase OCH1-like enzyme